MYSDRGVLWWTLKEKGVPKNYVNLIRAIYNSSNTCVRSVVGTTDGFGVVIALYQGSALRPFPPRSGSN